MIEEVIDKSNLGYPPYDVVDYGSGNYSIRLAVAGFSPSDLSVEASGDTLRVTGTKTVSNHDNGTPIHNGISKKSFVKVFNLGLSSIEIPNAKYVNGILDIALSSMANRTVRNIQIDIPQPSSSVYTGILNEESDF